MSIIMSDLHIHSGQSSGALRSSMLPSDVRTETSGSYSELLRDKKYIHRLNRAELLIAQILCNIKNKMNWSEKMKCSTIRKKWFNKIKEKYANSDDEYVTTDTISFLLKKIEITDKMIHIICQELFFMIGMMDKKANIHPSGILLSYHVDNYINDHTQKELIDYVNYMIKTEKINKKKNKLQIIHPSLYPCMQDGRTNLRHAFATIGVNVMNITKMFEFPWLFETSGFHMHSRQSSDALRSSMLPSDARTARIETSGNELIHNFKWLPSEFYVNNDGKTKIKSYINNLHPIKHKKLYTIIETIFDKFIPLFENVLTDMLYNHKHVNHQKAYMYHRSDYMVYIKKILKKRDERYNNLRRSDILINRNLIVKPLDFVYKPSIRTLSLKNRNLQVIVKLTSIELDNKTSEYKNDLWYTCGTEYEQIVAIGEYYFDIDNITDSKLNFRNMVNNPTKISNYEYQISSAQTYGQDAYEIFQNVGHMDTVKNRCICYPNIFQYQYDSFKLKNTLKSGHRRVLIFYLVDPFHKITSTINIFPQQYAWLSYELHRIKKLNKNVISVILSFLPVIKLSDARKHQARLIKERKIIIQY